jgi:hypothetical protein
MTETAVVAQPRTEDGDEGGVGETYREPAPSWRWGARAAVVLPIVVAVVRALVHGWFPIGDAALLAIRAYDDLREPFWRLETPADLPGFLEPPMRTPYWVDQ